MTKVYGTNEVINNLSKKIHLLEKRIRALEEALSKTKSDLSWERNPYATGNPVPPHDEWSKE